MNFTYAGRLDAEAIRRSLPRFRTGDERYKMIILGPNNQDAGMLTEEEVVDFIEQNPCLRTRQCTLNIREETS